jgi:hypothetical protein
LRRRRVFSKKAALTGTGAARAGAPFAINDAAKQVMDDLKADDNKRWKELRDHFAQEGVMKYVNRVITQAKAADPAQRQLPGLESMPLLITSEGADPCGTAQLREVPRRGRAWRSGSTRTTTSAASLNTSNKTSDSLKR